MWELRGRLQPWACLDPGNHSFAFGAPSPAGEELVIFAISTPPLMTRGKSTEFLEIFSPVEIFPPLFRAILKSKDFFIVNYKGKWDVEIFPPLFRVIWEQGGIFQGIRLITFKIYYRLLDSL